MKSISLSSATAAQVLEGKSLTSKRAIVTGGASGIGLETSLVLAQAGAEVVVAVRNLTAGEAAIAELRKKLQPGPGSLELMQLDLADLASVRRFVEGYLASQKPLDLLINNAGIMAVPEGKTAQGFELQVGTNHLGHFALTQGLLPALSRSTPARVVFLSSAAHKMGSRERLLARLKGETAKYTPFGAYGDSKLANLLTARALARRGPKGVEVFSVHPGVIPTPLSRHMGVMGKVYDAIGNTVGRLFMKSVQQGAATTVYAATAPELSEHSGAYLADCQVANSSPAGADQELAEQVWTLSEACLQRA